MRRMIDFDCNGDLLAGTVDEGDATAGLLIVSGGNEIRSGAYAGQAALAQHFAGKGHAVFRYDRRGVGESEGTNRGFENSADDIAAAVAALRTQLPHVQKLVAFGNCDAGTALALFHTGLPIDALVIANPWIIEASNVSPDTPTQPSAAAIRARYLARLKNPHSLLDLVTGKINLVKVARGLTKAVRKEAASGLAEQVASALVGASIPVTILIAERDATALAFMGAWKSAIFKDARAKHDIDVIKIDTASHSFADTQSRPSLFETIGIVLGAKQ